MRKIATTLLSLAVSLSVALGGATAANAAPAVTEIELTAGYNTIYRGGVVSLSEYVPPSTQIYLTVAACGRVLHTQTFNGVFENATSPGSPPYFVMFSKIIDKSMAGPTVDFTVSFSDPALPSTSSTAYTHPGYPRSCDALEPADDDGGDDGGSITVTKWSTKKGTPTAKVGKTLKVTPTRAPGAKVTYVWKVGTKTVDRDRAMTVKKSYKGKKVTMRVIVSKTGAKTVSKTLRYGSAR